MDARTHSQTSKRQCHNLSVEAKRSSDMGKLLATLKAILTRLVFGAHGLLAIWQVTVFKQNARFWYLCAPIVMLVFEGIFTLTIKRSQEWKWFVLLTKPCNLEKHL